VANPTVQTCPVCKLAEQSVAESDYGERKSLQCPRCGVFTITGTAEAMARSRDLGPKISAWIRGHAESGQPPPIITSETFKETSGLLPDYTVPEKQLLLLRALARRSKYPGEEFVLTPALDYPLAWAAGANEFRFHLNTLLQRRLLHSIGSTTGELGNAGLLVNVTAEGWAYLDEHNRSNVISDQAFVAMAFADELKAAWKDGIEPALSRAGYRPYRVDAKPHIDRIDAKIVSEIRNSRLVVADVTTQRPGVYFEAGFAIGLGLPVFWSVRKDDLAKVHFDTRQYNHIVWETPADFGEQLEAFVLAVIGRGGAT
jgi:nucleoside 2-deoxyribosyltransferase